MKNLFIPSILIAIILVSACSDNDQAKTSASPLAGTWALTHFIITDCNEEGENTEYEVSCTSQNCSKITITKNGAFKTELTIGGHTEVDQGTYIINGNSLQICDQTGAECSPAVFELTNEKNTLMIEEVDGETACTAIAIYERM